MGGDVVPDHFLEYGIVNFLLFRDDLKQRIQVGDGGVLRDGESVGRFIQLVQQFHHGLFHDQNLLSIDMLGLKIQGWFRAIVFARR